MFQKLFNYKNKLIIVLIILLGIFNSICLYYLFSKPQKEYELNDFIIDEKMANNDEPIESIKVDLKGAIDKPGIYEMKTNDTLYNLILKAGGFTEDAYTSNLGLSSLLKDEQIIYISTKKEVKKTSNDTSKKTNTTNNNRQPSYSITTSQKTSDKELNSEQVNSSEKSNPDDNNENLIVNINTASQIELTKLNGIGMAKALAIIDYRNANGNFQKIEDILNVKGIGESIYAKIKDYITV